MDGSSNSNSFINILLMKTLIRKNGSSMISTKRIVVKVIFIKKAYGVFIYIKRNIKKVQQKKIGLYKKIYIFSYKCTFVQHF